MLENFIINFYKCRKVTKFLKQHIVSELGKVQRFKKIFDFLIKLRNIFKPFNSLGMILITCKKSNNPPVHYTYLALYLAASKPVCHLP